MPEFQVIVLSGGAGLRLYPLTEDTPKSMLPVANRPLISYQLELLESVGFTEAIVVTNGETFAKLKKFVQEMYRGKLKVHVEGIKGQQLGTAEALLKVKEKIKSKDFMVVSGDLLVEESVVHSLADIHRTRDAAATVLLKRPPPVDPQEARAARKKAGATAAGGDFIGLDDRRRVVYFSAAADLEEHIVVRKSLLRSYPDLTIYTNLLDAHFYIFARWVLDVLEAEAGAVTSIKGELLPLLVKLQLRKKLPHVPASVLPGQGDGVQQMSSSSLGEHDRLGIFAHVMDEGLCCRVNTVQNFLEMNREIATGNYRYQPLEQKGKNNFVDESAQVDPKTQIGPECVVGESTKIGEKGSVKKSNIGKHCNIANGVKIVNSVVMDYVTIAESTTIQNSVVCSNVHIGAHCTIKDCQIGGGCSLAPKSNVSNSSLGSRDEAV